MKKSTVIIIWGVITSLASILYGIFLNMQGLSLSGWHYINLLIVFMGFFVGTYQYREKANGGYLTYGQGYVAGLMFTAIITVLSVISLLITLKIEPDLGDKLLNQLQIQLVNKGLTEEQINMVMKMYSKSFTPAGMITYSIIGNIFIGTILSLITAGLNTKKKPIFDDTEMPGNDGAQA